MAAQVHAIATVIDGPGDAADLCIGLQDNGTYVRALQQLERRCQARGARPSNDRDLFHSGSLRWRKQQLAP